MFQTPPGNVANCPAMDTTASTRRSMQQVLYAVARAVIAPRLWPAMTTRSGSAAGMASRPSVTPSMTWRTRPGWKGRASKAATPALSLLPGMAGATTT